MSLRPRRGRRVREPLTFPAVGLPMATAPDPLSETDGASKPSNTAQLRADIDSGRTGDKIGGFDPAAAPLGTDEEAAGTPLSAAEIEQARQLEARPPTPNANAASPKLQPDG